VVAVRALSDDRQSQVDFGVGFDPNAVHVTILSESGTERRRTGTAASG
jgi:hypothetical protein